jgi:hypothetical protein
MDLYGTTSPWSFALAKRLIAGNEAFTVLMWSDSRLWAELVYHGAIAASVMLLLGWRTRLASVLFMVGVLSLQNRSVFMGDGGDNVIHLMSIYLVLTRCGQVWSLDARRRREEERRRREEKEGEDRQGEGKVGAGMYDRTGVILWAVVGVGLFTAQVSGFADLPFFSRGLIPGVGWGLIFWGLWLIHAGWWWLRRRGESELRSVVDVMANLVHNGAMLIIVVEVCFIYSTAGWYKIQGTRWQDGTAVYYPLHLDYFSPWPALGDLLAASGIMVMLVTYGTVAAQVAFPFTLFNRRVKNVLLAVMMVEHAAIAVVLGLPFFSLAMIAADAVFLPTPFLRRLGSLAARGARRLSGRPATARVPGPRAPQPAEQPQVGSPT